MRKYVVTIVLMLAVATVAQAQTVEYLFNEVGGSFVGNSGTLGALADGDVINGEGDELGGGNPEDDDCAKADGRPRAPGPGKTRVKLKV